MTAPADQLWAYLHNELAPEEKMIFEQAVQSNPVLHQKLNEYRATHEQLKNILPLLNDEKISDEHLEEALLTEWESEHPEYAERPARKPLGKILRFTLPLAAAAAAAILLALPSASIHWQKTIYGSAPQLRGQPIAKTHYTRAELKQASRELQNAVNEACRQPERWNLQISLQELADGALAVEVSGHLRGNSGVSKIWNKNFQGLEPFRQEIPRFGKQIADDLAKQVSP